METTERVRLDKWLWAARFFKTRVLAGRACELGRVACNGQQTKPGREVKAGDLLQVKNDSGEFEVEVLLLSQTRGPATIAQTLYQESAESKLNRQKISEERRVMPRVDSSSEGRPSKRDRREYDRVRGRT